MKQYLFLSTGCPKKMVTCFSKLEWIGLNYIVTFFGTPCIFILLPHLKAAHFKSLTSNISVKIHQMGQPRTILNSSDSKLFKAVIDCPIFLVKDLECAAFKCGNCTYFFFRACTERPQFCSVFEPALHIWSCRLCQCSGHLLWFCWKAKVFITST